MSTQFSTRQVPLLPTPGIVLPEMVVTVRLETDEARVAVKAAADDHLVLLDPDREFIGSLELEYLPLDGVQATFADRPSRVVAMINLLRLSYADGAFEIEEECLLKEVSRAFELGDDEFLLLDNWVRRWLALEEEAQALM